MTQEIPHARLLERSPEIVCCLDEQERIRYANPAAALATGRPLEHLIGRTLAEAGLPPTLIERLQGAFAAARGGELPAEVVVELQSPWGERHVALQVLPDRSAAGEPLLLLFGRDISAQHKMEQELGRLATTDSLTGLYNRQQFFAQGEKDFIRAKRYLKPLSVMMIDLDHFKPLNDAYGLALGDHVLVQVARALEDLLRSSDLVCRFEGGTFAVGMADTTLEQATAVGRRVLERIAALELAVVDQPVRLTASLGASQLLFRDDGLADLLARAESGLRQAKAAGRNRLVSVDSDP